MQSRDDSMNDRGKRYTSKHLPNDLANVLHRPVESAAKSGRPLQRIVIGHI